MPRADSLARCRSRIYGNYVKTRPDSATPKDSTALARHLPYFRKLVREYFPPDRGSRIVDLGCGYGRFVYALQLAGYSNVTGIDVSAEQIANAKALGVLGIAHGDIFDFLAHASPASFDVVISFDILEHFTKDESLDFVDAVHRILKPGGRWLIHVPNAESPFWGRVRYGDFSHEQAFTRLSLQQLLLSSGFISVECFEDRPTIHGAISAVRAVLWQIVRMILNLYLAVEDGTLERTSLFSQNILALAVRE